MHKYFERKTRDNGDSFYILSENAPEWVRDAIRSAHCDCSDLPNDWIYETCHEAFCAIEDDTLISSDDTFEFSDGLVDTYNYDLLKWATEMYNTYTYCNAKQQYEDCDGSLTDELDIIRAIQFWAIDNIVNIILDAHLDNEESESN